MSQLSPEITFNINTTRPPASSPPLFKKCIRFRFLIPPPSRLYSSRSGLYHLEPERLYLFESLVLANFRGNVTIYRRNVRKTDNRAHILHKFNYAHLLIFMETMVALADGQGYRKSNISIVSVVD